MQLFITPFAAIDSGKKNIGEIISLDEERVVHQVKHVLRGKSGMRFFVQQPCYAATLLANQEDHYRYLVELIDIQKDSLVCKVHEILLQKIIKNNDKLCVALPNKFEKIELIVQKATELGMQHLLFFPSEYSQIHEISKNKIQRLAKIAWEATEQSYGYIIPNIIFEKNIQNILHVGINILLHQEGGQKEFGDFKKNNGINFFVGPEGGRSQGDGKIFDEHVVEKISLGKNILRTETAAIIVAWEASKLGGERH